VQTALTEPQTVGQPFAWWTLDRLAAYLAEEKGIAMKRSRIAGLLIAGLLIAEGLRWRKEEAWVGFAQRVDPACAGNRRPSHDARRRLPPAASSSVATRWVR
jgi:hypothetical protein